MTDWGLLCKQIDSSWVELAETVRRGDSGKSRRDCAQAARKLLQLAAFLQLCRRKRLLPHAAACGQTFDEVLDEAQGRFGSALFQTQDDCFNLGRTIDPRAWQSAFARLADFDGPPDILARIHQRLLSRRLADAGPGSAASGAWRSLSENTTQKAGGVFYTPDYVTRYMLGQALDGTNSELPTLLDPSCGCGAFLLAAFRAMLARRTVDVDNFDARLEILRHIHGADIDAQAVLVARRSLWLEMCCGRGSAVADVLDRTIRVADTLADDFRQKIPGQTAAYDIVVGNPPYRRELGTKSLLDQIARTSLGRRWRTARMDLWYYFVHRGLELLADDGILSFIVSGYWMTGSGAGKLIDQLRREAHIEEIFDLGNRNVFENVNGRHMILRIRKTRCDKPTTIKQAAARQAHKSHDTAQAVLDGAAALTFIEKTASQLFRQGRIDIERPRDDLLGRIAGKTPLCSLGNVRQGIAENPSTINRRTNHKYGDHGTVGEGVFALTADEVAALDLPEAEKKLLRPYHDLCDLGRYRLAATPSRQLIYSTAETWPRFDMYPVLGRHLERFRPIMENRRETRRGRRPWWQLHWPRDAALWQSAKIISVQMAARPAFVSAREPAYVPFSANVFIPDESVQEHLNYFAAVLNSSLMGQWYSHHAKRRGVGLEINGRVLGETPISRIDFNSAKDRARHDRLVELVDQMLALPGKKTEETDGEIDEIVSDLYGTRTTSNPATPATPGR